MITAAVSVDHEPIDASRHAINVAAGKGKVENHPDLESARRRCVPQFPRKMRESHQTGSIPKLNDVDPQAWLADVLARLPDHPAKRLDELLPWNWKASRTGTSLAQAA